MAKYLTKEERQMFTQLFLKMDKSGKGWLSREELKKGMEKLYEEKISHFEMEEFFREVDKNKDGRIQLDEFLRAAGKLDLELE